MSKYNDFEDFMHAVIDLLITSLNLDMAKVYMKHMVLQKRSLQ